MIEIIKVETEQMAMICDQLLTELINSERRFDSNLSPNYVVQDYYPLLVNDPNVALFLAFQNRKPVGFLYGYIKGEEGTLFEKSVGFIDALYVSKCARHQGIGHKLMTCFEDWARQRGIGMVKLVVFAENAEAFQLYQDTEYEVETYGMSKTLK